MNLIGVGENPAMATPRERIEGGIARMLAVLPPAALHEGLVHGFANAVRLGRTSPAAMRPAVTALAAV